MANVAFVKRVLYKLKRNYGYPLDLYKILETSEDVATGKKTVRRARHHLHKAIILTAAELKRQYQYDMSYVAVNQRFSYGAFYDTEALFLIIDCVDLPRGLVLTLDDFAIYKHKRYNFDKVEPLEQNLAYMIKMRESKGAVAGEIHEVSVTNILMANHEVDLIP